MFRDLIEKPFIDVTGLFLQVNVSSSERLDVDINAISVFAHRRGGMLPWCVNADVSASVELLPMFVHVTETTNEKK